MISAEFRRLLLEGTKKKTVQIWHGSFKNHLKIGFPYILVIFFSNTIDPSSPRALKDPGSE